MANQVEVKISDSMRIMTPDVFQKNGSIAVSDIHIVIDGVVLTALRNVWLKKVTVKGVTQLEVSGTSFPSSSNKVNPKTGKPYNEVPFTILPKITKTGVYGSYSDQSSPMYQALCKSFYDKAVKQGFVETANSTVAKSASSVSF